jgi:hypothetical protein
MWRGISVGESTGRKTAKVGGGYDGDKYIKKIYNFVITYKYCWRGKDLNLRS